MQQREPTKKVGNNPDNKAFAIRLFSDTLDMESAFKVKVWIGGVNVLQHTTNDGKRQIQDYFVFSEQRWIWGKQVDETTARQFRVFGHSKASYVRIITLTFPYHPSLSSNIDVNLRLSARAQLKGDNIVKEVEIEIIPREQRPRTPSSLARYRQSSRSPTAADSSTRRSRSESPAATLVHTDTEISISSHSMTPSTGPTTPQGSTPTLDENTVVSFSSTSSSGTASSQGCSCHLDRPEKQDRPAGLESIHSTPEPGASTNPHQMVIGTGGLIRQIVEKDQHPDWIDKPDGSVTLKFKIFDPEFFEEATDIPLGDPGGNYKDPVPNPPDKCFRSHRPIVQHPKRLRKDLLSPMELEGVGGEDERNAFLSLWGEALNQPRKEQTPWPPTAGLMTERPKGPEPEKEGEKKKPEPQKPTELEPKPQPEPVSQQPKPLPVPVSDKPEKQDRNNSNNSNSSNNMEPPRPRDMPRSIPTTRTSRCTTDMVKKESSTKRWKSKWRRFITFMKRALSPGS